MTQSMIQASRRGFSSLRERLAFLMRDAALRRSAPTIFGAMAVLAAGGCLAQEEARSDRPSEIMGSTPPSSVEAPADSLSPEPPRELVEPQVEPDAETPPPIPQPVPDFERFRRPFPPGEGARPEIYTDPRSPYYFDLEEMELRSLEQRARMIGILDTFEFQGLIVHDEHLLEILEEAVRSDEELAKSIRVLSESDLEVRIFQANHRGVPRPYQGQQGLLLFDRIVPIEAGDDWPTRTIDVLIDHHGIDRVAHFVGVDDEVSLEVVAERIQQETAGLLARELRKAAAVALAGGRVGAAVESGGGN